MFIRMCFCFCLLLFLEYIYFFYFREIWLNMVMYVIVSIIINVFFKIGIVWKCWKMIKEKICLKIIVFCKEYKNEKVWKIEIILLII